MARKVKKVVKVEEVAPASASVTEPLAPVDVERAKWIRRLKRWSVKVTQAGLDPKEIAAEALAE